MRLVAIAFGAVCLSGSALAADQPVGPYPAPPPYASPPAAYNWTGSYLGVNVGYGWAEAIVTASAGSLSASASQKLQGVIGGIQGGNNFQMGNFVFGVETDFQLTGQQYKYSSNRSDSIPWLWTTRLRAGVAVDRVLIYATAGAGLGEFRSEAGSSSSSEQRWAGVVGGGIEAALVGGWTAKAEALYLQSISRERQIFGIKVEDHVTDAVVRLGVNYRFGLPGY